ncbi:MAG: hypothetical protein LBI18_09385 [Planctomycetaceae bacterium]|nr:hypothetical protein [Planctomycetaceae bacterium]
MLFIFFCVVGIVGATDIAEADAAFERKNYTTALELYRQTRQNQKDANWKRLTIQMIRCCLAQGDTEQAVQEYFLLCRVVDSAPPLEWIPLPWFVPIEAVMGMSLREKIAETWLDPLRNSSPNSSPNSPQNSSPAKPPNILAATLLAAGTLSVSPNTEKQRRGYQILRELETLWETAKTTPNIQESAFQRHIALLATALRWKQRIPNLKNQSELLPLQRILEQIPESCQAGPLFLFGQAARIVGDHETAVLTWMRIPICYSENQLLSVEALREAAQSLEKLGRFDQAKRLQTERLRLEANSPSP